MTLMIVPEIRKLLCPSISVVAIRRVYGGSDTQTLDRRFRPCKPQRS